MKKILLFLLLLTSTLSYAQQNEEEEKKRVLQKLNSFFKALENKVITIKGFLIPLQEQKKHSYFLLSAFPFDQCFYCGKAGPETVIEVTVKKAIKTTM